jgi:hypothetical protein
MQKLTQTKPKPHPNQICDQALENAPCDQPQAQNPNYPTALGAQNPNYPTALGAQNPNYPTALGAQNPNYPTALGAYQG